MAFSLATSRSALCANRLHGRTMKTPNMARMILPRVAMNEPSPLSSPRPAGGDPQPQPQSLSTVVDIHHTPILSRHNAQLVGGRLAMIGFVAGVLGELTHGTSLFSQLLAAEPVALATAVLLSVASAAPLLAGEEEGDEVVGPFTPEAEIINGNLAIAGVTAMLVVEALKGSALL